MTDFIEGWSLEELRPHIEDDLAIGAFEITEENLVFIVLDEDPIIHTDASPWCIDPTCPCHQDADLLREYSTKPITNGLLTQREALRLFLSEHL